MSLPSRPAATDHPILDVLSARWSTRAFDHRASIDEAKLSSALEAARWTPSASNGQPWRFVVARRGSDTHRRIADTLTGFNTVWAPHAAVLLVGLIESTTEQGEPISHAEYDLGQAVAHLSIQAHHDGLAIHQMAGFDAAPLQQTLDLPSRFVPTIVLALGTYGDPSVLPEALQERETSPRTRRPIAESVLLSD